MFKQHKTPLKSNTGVTYDAFFSKSFNTTTEGSDDRNFWLWATGMGLDLFNALVTRNIRLNSIRHGSCLMSLSHDRWPSLPST